MSSRAEKDRDALLNFLTGMYAEIEREWPETSAELRREKDSILSDIEDHLRVFSPPRNDVGSVHREI